MADRRFFRTAEMPGEVVAGTIAVAAGLIFSAEEAAEFDAAVREVRTMEQQGWTWLAPQ